ncbi:MAG: DNA-binding protein [Gammaproteobacteria bacterium]|nr:DNA-binding protein [Gammaproteobacteria bacterium]
MKKYEFTLKFSLQDASINPEIYVERLGAQGCDDALIGIGQNGRIALNFTREATSAFEAISSALANIKCVIPDAQLIEATPDLVGLTDAAEILGFTRQNMRKLMLASGTPFPAPIHEGKSAIWHLSQVLTWLKERNNYQIEDTLLEIAKTNMQFNIVKQTHDIDPGLQEDIRKLIA